MYISIYASVMQMLCLDKSTGIRNFEFWSIELVQY